MRLLPLIGKIISLCLFLLTIVNPTNRNNAFAQTPEEESVMLDAEVIGQKIPPYGLNLRQIIEEAKRNIEKVEKRIKEEEIFARKKSQEEAIGEHFKRGNALYLEGKSKEALREWQEVIRLTQTPEIRAYMQEIDKRIAEAERLAKEKEVETKAEKIKMKQLRAEKLRKNRLEEIRQLRSQKEKEERKRQEEKEQLRAKEKKYQEAVHRQEKKKEEINKRREEINKRKEELKRKEEMKKQLKGLKKKQKPT